MKKRVLLVVAAMSLLVAVGLTGCGGTTVADPNAASSAAAPTASMALSEVSEDNLNGMITYLKGTLLCLSIPFPKTSDTLQKSKIS